MSLWEKQRDKPTSNQRLTKKVKNKNPKGFSKYLRREDGPAVGTGAARHGPLEAIPVSCNTRTGKLICILNYLIIFYSQNRLSFIL